jgi:DNA invertase Pin-like site-specific DNA recombinase
MIQDSAKNNFDIVLVWKLDRFARNRLDSATYRAVLKRNGVNVVSIKENISDGPEGIILEALLEGMAEYYSAELSVKIKRGQKENALKCKANGTTAPFGLRINADKLYEIDPLTAPIVREIFERYADGQTAKEILHNLHERNILAGCTQKFKNKSSIYFLLKNRKYIGEYKYGDTLIPDGIPAIVSHETFERVQERIEKNKHKPAAKKADDEYVLTSKLFCGKCGAMMTGTGGTSQTGKVYHYYKCSANMNKKSCDKKAVNKEWIEQLVVSMAQDYVLQDDVIDRLADKVLDLFNRENMAIPYLQKQLADVDKRINNVLKSIEEGISGNSVKKRLADLETMKEEIEISLAKEQIEKPPLEKEQIVFWISRFKGGDVNDPAYRRSIVDIFVNSVFLHDDRLVVGFNWRDGTKTLSLSELEKADKASDNAENKRSYLVQTAPLKSKE